MQAFWRGTLVRKQVMLLRNEYERVLKEIEGPECSLQLTWQYDLFSRPEIAKSGKPGLSVIRIDKPTCALTQDEVSPEISSEISDHPSHKKLKDDVCDNGIKISDQNTEPERDNSEGEYLANTKPSKDCPSEPPTSISPPTISEENFEGVGSQLAENINNNTSNDDGNLGPADFESLQPHTQVWDTMDMDSSQAQPKGCNPLNGKLTFLGIISAFCSLLDMNVIRLISACNDKIAVFPDNLHNA